MSGDAGERTDVTAITSIADAKEEIEGWRVDYNQRRSQGSLGHLTPDEYAVNSLSKRVGASKS